LLIYGISALTGGLPPSLTPWAGRKGPWSAGDEQRQGIVFIIVTVMGGTILFVGGVGLMIVSLL
jgi:hypothetical protein